MTKPAPSVPLMSVVLPVFNEASTLESVLEKVRCEDCVSDVIIVDDASTDGTLGLLNRFECLPNVRVFRQATNRGKGAALKHGFAQATGDIVIIQDADLEYDPADYPKLAEPILSGTADVVYGSRFLPGADSRMPRLTFWANRLITWLFNLVMRQRLTDVETCYKAIRRDIVRQITPALREDRFGVEIEVTARIVKIPGVRLLERPIWYRARTHREGKKIGWIDGFRALWCILKYR